MKEMYRRILAVAALCVLTLNAATVRLYLKDGSYQSAREYQVLGDRVRYFSTERDEWEEIPLTLVDLKKTEGEIKARADERKTETREFDEEEKAERAERKEIEAVPYEPGVYQVSGENVKALKQVESKAVTDKRRSILKAMAPIPVVSGKASIEIEGPHAPYAVESNLPEFYFRLADEERFGIARLKPTKTGRSIQTWTIVPVSKEIVEEMDAVEVFKRQLVEGLYKVWPAKPLPAGEYAVFEYTEGKGNIQAWDFTVPESVGAPPEPAQPASTRSKK